MSNQPKIRNVIAVVPIRSGSKGLPGKNTRILAGIPLYEHALQQGVRTIGHVLLSTDIKNIASENLPEHCYLTKRTPELAADDTPMVDVLTNVIETESLWDFTLVLLQATTPLRSDQDIIEALSLYNTGHYDLVMSVVERDRQVLKYGLLQGKDFSALRDPALCFENRQNLPPVYGPNGAVYVFSAQEFIESGGFPTARIGAIKMPASRSIDIDSADDFELAEKAISFQRSKLNRR